MKEAAITSPSLSAVQDLKGKTIIVTGAGSGIGRESAIIFSLAGANVIVSDITAESAKATVDSIHSRGGIATFVKADLSVEAEVQLLVSAAVETYGRLDGAFNNAGIGQVGKPLHEVSTQEWQRALLVDLTSVFWCMKYQILAMMTTGGGAIVNTASALGQVAIPHAGEYVAAKHGVIGITRAAAADYGAKGVRVNCVLPGIIKTPLIDELSTDPRFASSLEKLLERHPIGRFGNPSEIGEAARWLLSDAASFVNGSAIAVDGGYLAV